MIRDGKTYVTQPADTSLNRVTRRHHLAPTPGLRLTSRLLDKAIVRATISRLRSTEGGVTRYWEERILALLVALLIAAAGFAMAARARAAGNGTECDLTGHRYSIGDYPNRAITGVAVDIPRSYLQLRAADPGTPYYIDSETWLNLGDANGVFNGSWMEGGLTRSWNINFGAFVVTRISYEGVDNPSASPPTACNFSGTSAGAGEWTWSLQ